MPESGNIKKICFAGDTAAKEPVVISPSLKNILKSHDIAVLNFEGAFSKLRQPLSKAGSHILLKTEYFAPLAECFNVATLANNHVMDYQIEGLRATIEGCEKAGVQTVGAGFNLQEAFTPLDIGNCRIISVAEHEFGGAGENKAGIATVDRPSEIYKVIKEGCELGKQVFIASHGGSELISIPPPYLRERYKLWIDYGACGVIGNHPHVVQGYELYKGRPIFYSLGNFVFIKDDSFNDLPNAQWSIVVSLDVSTGDIQIIPVQSDGSGTIDVIEDKNKYTQELARLCDLLKPENYLELYRKTAAELYKIRYPGLPCTSVHSAQVLLHYLRCDAHRSMIQSGLVGVIDELNNNVSSDPCKQIDNFANNKSNDSLYEFCAKKMQMCTEEQQLLYAVLKGKKRYLEIGSGFSTIWSSRFVREVVSVEARKPWYEKLKEYLQKYGINNVQLNLFPPEPCAYYEDGKEKWNNRHTPEGSDYGTAEEFEGYLKRIEQLLDRYDFDVVLVDGHVRQQVVEMLVKKNFKGAVLLHDVMPERDYMNRSILELEGVEVVKQAKTLAELRLGQDSFDARDREPKADRAKVTMSSLGHDGRFANQIFQYAFLRDYARKHGLDYETSSWPGQYLFGHKDNPISVKLPQIKEKTPFAEGTFDINSGQCLSNVDIGGYFQYDISWAQQEIDFFRSLFRPVDSIRNEMEKGLAKLRLKGKTIVGLHLRRGDFGYEYFFIAPSRWYLEWLEQIWPELDEPVLFIASDEPEKVVGDFSKYNPVTSQDLGVELPQASFYPDFYFLSQCDVTAISNSSFSFAASLLNERCRAFYRPHLPSRQLICYDPLTSKSTLFHDKVRPEDDECSIASNNSAVPKRGDSVTLKTMDGEAMDFPVLRSDSSLVKEIPNGHKDIIEDVHRWSNPRLAYLASADQWLGFKAFFEKSDVMQCDVFYCAIGGLGGLNLLGYLNQTKKIIFYDVNAFAALVCDLQLQLIRHCQSVDEYISLIYRRPFDSKKYNFEKQRDFLQLPIESKYAQKLEQILSSQAYNTYNYYYLPLITQTPCSIYDGATVHCTDLLPFFESKGVRDPLVSGPLSNGSVNINTFYVGKGWLSSDQTFLSVRKRLAESEIEIRIGDIGQIKPEGQFPGIYITNIYSTGKEDGYKQFANMFKWIVGYDDNTDFEVQYFPNHNGIEGMVEYDRRIGAGDGNPHATCCRAIDNVIDLNSNEFLEVIEPHPIEGMNYGFRFYRGQKRISVEDYLKTKVDSEEIIGVHILLGGGTSQQIWRQVCRKAVTESKRYVMIFEHCAECTDWPGRDVHSDNLLPHRKLDQFIYSLDYRWKKFGMPNVKGDINDIRNIMYFLEKDGQREIDRCEEQFNYADLENYKAMAAEHFGMGVKALQSGDAREALEYFDKARSMNPKIDNLHYTMATAFAQLGEMFSARQACEIAISLEPQNSNAAGLLEQIGAKIEECQVKQSVNKPLEVVSERQLMKG